MISLGNKSLVLECMQLSRSVRWAHASLWPGNGGNPGKACKTGALQETAQGRQAGGAPLGRSPFVAQNSQIGTGRKLPDVFVDVRRTGVRLESGRQSTTAFRG